MVCDSAAESYEVQECALGELVGAELTWFRI